MQNGKIGVTTENIFPIIKKFLYSDHEIFLRELVSNAVDATQKLKTLAAVGEFKGEIGDTTINVSLDPESRTLTVSDRGIGMTAEEIEKYINQIAFSGAEEFMKMYDNPAGMIGHFGLGFYSAFMVAGKVEIVSRSYKDGAVCVKWSCEGTPEYTLEEIGGDFRRGTDIILHIDEENSEFAEKGRIESLLRKYCGFLPVPISFGKVQEWKDGKHTDTDKDLIINDTNPVWTRKPSEITEEEYAAFYSRLYPMAEPPLFNIHLNIDYPFNLTGVLYFPKIRNNFDMQKNRIQLYSNQVFVTDSVEGIVPEFLTLLNGVIDSPDIPLNVSRSYLQSDSNVKKISGYITRKVAERLGEIFNNSRADFEAKWDDLKVFIQYGVVSDEKFAEKAADFTLLKNTSGKYFTLPEYETLVKDNQTDRNGTTVYLYTNDKVAQHSFVEAASRKGYDVLVMDGQLDNHFVAWCEAKREKVRFVRVDSEVAERLIDKDKPKSIALTTAQQDILRPVFESQFVEDPSMHYTVSFEAMDEAEQPVVITRGEYLRRMKDISAMGGGMNSFYGSIPDSYTVAVNGNHPLVIESFLQVEKSAGEEIEEITKKIDAATAESHSVEERLKGVKEEEISTEDKKARDDSREKLESLTASRNGKLREIGRENKLVKQLIDLALLSNGMLKGEELTRFITRSVELIKS